MQARLTLALVVLTAAAVPSAAQAAVVGALTQLAGPAGCVSGSARCTPARGLGGAGAVTVSPDGRNVYGASFDALTVFAREPGSGRLRQLVGPAGCLKTPALDHPRDESCTAVRGGFFGQGDSLAVSPDGRNLYAAHSSGVSTFARDPATGALTQLPGPAGCLIAQLTDTCARGRGIRAATGVALSANGRRVYVSAFNSGAIAVFDRDPATGVLEQVGCMSVRRDEGCTRARALYGPEELAVSPDGRSVYVAALGGLGIFARSPRSGRLTQPTGEAGCINRSVESCRRVTGLGEEVFSVAVAPDGAGLLLGSSTCGGPCFGSVTAFRRSPRTGALARVRGRVGCVSQRGERSCSAGRALAFVHSMAVSPDGRSVYAVGGTSVAVLGRDARSGKIAQLAGRAGVARGAGVGDTRSVAVSPDGRNVYAASEDRNAVAVFARRRP